MLKKRVFYGMAAFFLLAGNYAFGSSQLSKNIERRKGSISKSVQDRAVKYADFTEIWLILSPRLQNMVPREKLEAAILEKISKLEDYIKRRPSSFLVDEAKMDIAELYHMLVEEEGKNRQGINQDKIERWGAEANRWLMDVVVHHSNNSFFNLDKAVETKEPTAARALFYLAMWNNNQFFLEKLVEKYPDSEIAKIIKQRARPPEK